MQFISIDNAYLPKDEMGYQYFPIISIIFSKFVQATPVKEQTAPTILDALLRNWIYIHGSPFYLLSDQGTNVDGEVIAAICNKLGIEKCRYSHIIVKGMDLPRGTYVLSKIYYVLLCYIVIFLKRNGAQ